MRKASREMDATFALEVMDKAPYVTVSMMRPDGTPYGLPLSLARTDDKTFYFHCALEGDKLDCIAANPTVALSAVTKCAPTVGPKDGSFTLQYKSATAVGKAEIVTDHEEKIAGLRAICQRFLPHHMDAFDDAIARSLERTAVVRITLTEPPVGKRKQYDKEGEEMTGQSSESRRARSNGRVDGRRQSQRPDVQDADPSQPAIGYVHLSFAVGSRKGVDLLTRRLAADGYTVTSGPRTTGDGYYESSILGPEGIQIELTE